MVTAAWDSSNLVALYKDGLQCETCCTEYSVVDCCCFLEPETVGACGNEDWDSYPPYGGVGRTPQFYTLTYKIHWQESGLIDTFHSDILERGGAYENCHWGDVTTQDSNGQTITARIFLRHSDIPNPSDKTQVFLTFNHGTCNPPDHGTGVYEIYVDSALSLGECDIKGDFSCDASVSTTNCCLIRMKDSGTQDWEYGDIEVAWYPGQVPEWDSGAGYVVGDIVAWEGVFYSCSNDNVNQEPPNVTYWAVI